MKAKNKLYILAALAFLAGFVACSNEELNISGEGDINVLTLNYRIDGGVENNTYALPAELYECRVNEVYVLFFRASDYASEPNQFVGCTRVKVFSSSPSGSVRVAPPANENADDVWQLLFLANLDGNMSLNGEVSIKERLKKELSGKTFDEVKGSLTTYFDKTSGLSAPFPMSFSAIKTASAPSVDITFKRHVARIDVSNSDSRFILESAQVWNARTSGFLFGEGGNAGDGFTNYTGQSAAASAGVVQGMLYVFPNFAEAPTIQDHETTCLIIGGKYDGSDQTTYYRVNVCVSGKQQYIKPNGAYMVHITKVTGNGETDPEKAYDQSTLQMEYILNKWDDSFLGTYVFDADGNGLAVSQRNVTFSNEGEQKLQLEVFTIKSSIHPISAEWSIGIAGTDAASFSAERGTTVFTKNYVQVSTLTDNATAVNRQAEVTINWGGIRIPVNLTQLNPASILAGIQVSPAVLWLPLTGSSKEIRVSLSGDYVGVTRNDITVDVSYNGKETGWISLLPGTTADDPGTGVFYYTVSAGRSDIDLRTARFRFVVKQGSTAATTQMEADQSAYYEGGNYIRQSNVYLLQKSTSDNTYTNLGLYSTQYTKLLGLPSDLNTPDFLHLSMMNSGYLKYKLSIRSFMDWKVVIPEEMKNRLNFSLESGSGDPNNWTAVEVSAKGDVETPWNGTFYIEYEDGAHTVYAIGQKGIIALLPSNNNIYFYGTMTVNGKLWLDRNLGATVGQKRLDGYYSNFSYLGDVTNVSAGKGLYFYRAQADIACPPGFRLPKRTADSGEWDWVFNNKKGAYSAGVLLYGKSCKNLCYVPLSVGSEDVWLLPVCGYNNSTGNTYGYYWSQEAGYFSFSYDGGNPRLFTTDPTTQTAYSVRCIRDN